MKNTKFNFDGKTFEIYNTTDNLFHCVELNKKGERKSPNTKTLTTFTPAIFDFGVRTGGISII